MSYHKIYRCKVFLLYVAFHGLSNDMIVKLCSHNRYMRMVFHHCELFHDALNSVYSGTFFGKYCMNIWALHELFDDISMLQDGDKFLSICCRLLIFHL